MTRPFRFFGPLLAGTALVALLLLAIVIARCGAPPPPPAAPPPAPAAEVPAEAPAPPAEDPLILRPGALAVPGVRPVRVLRYANAAARAVAVSGSWDGWAVKRPLARRADGLWGLDTGPLKLKLGRYEFKFLPDGGWEPGENRVLFVNEEGNVERPPELVFAARMESPTRIDVYFRRKVPPGTDPKVRLVPETPIQRMAWTAGPDSRRRLGFAVAGDYVTFCMDERFYGLNLSVTDRVGVAGAFNGWNPSAGGGWLLERRATEPVWERTFPLPRAADPANGGAAFKFMLDGHRWLEPPLMAPNATSDGHGNTNLRIDPSMSETPVLSIYTAAPLVISNSYSVLIDGVAERPVFHPVTPGDVLDRFVSAKPLGAILEQDRHTTLFRLFAPRASKVDVCFFDQPEYPDPESDPRRGAAGPREVVPLSRDAEDGVWEARVPGLRRDAYYAFRIDGPTGAGEGFNPRRFAGDPYARAAAHARNSTLILDPDATNEWFGGWTDGDWRPPPPNRMVIYEAHVRDLTSHRSSGVADGLRGKYEGFLATLGTGAGIDHLKRMGVNMVELLPVAEFENGEDMHSWGYMTAYYFAPEASYARAPLKGSQYYEFKRLVNALHRQGIGVILDMVYNHVGPPYVFSAIDRFYYFRMDQDFRLQNYSGCGNDCRTEAPMLRRLIVDNILYWMREHHVDGFRFDLAELIDLETLMAVRDAARRENPNVVLISEPWSFRGDHKRQLRGTGWACWNDQFREAAKRFARGDGDRGDLQRAIAGSGDTFAANPMQSVNYLESHDDMTLADELSTDERRDGRKLKEPDAARNRLAATVLFTSLGIPMLDQGQEWIRSKWGCTNTYNKGDAVNGVNWSDRLRPLAAETMRYYRELIALRQSAAGASLRWTEAVPGDYFRWVWPPEGRALGYLVNPERKYPGAGVAVLLNASTADVEFDVDFPAGPWRLIGNGRRIDPRGIGAAGAPDGLQGRHTLRVPPLSAWILLRE